MVGRLRGVWLGQVILPIFVVVLEVSARWRSSPGGLPSGWLLRTE
jgi:hypothetical protein